MGLRGAEHDGSLLHPDHARRHNRLDHATAADPDKKPRKLVKDEHRETGGVKWSIYNSYLKASYVCPAFDSSKVINGPHRSYWIWGFLAFMVVVVQILGASEKLWITVWGDAYPEPGNVTSSSFLSFRPTSSMPDNEALPFGFVSHHHYHQTAFRSLADIDDSAAGGSFGYEWPDASTRPFFYVGVYGAIGFAMALANILSVTAQYTAALRASRILFKYVPSSAFSPATPTH